MRVCILGSSLTALTLAKALVKENIYVDLVSLSKNKKIDDSRTIGISRTNFEFINENLVNIQKIVWSVKKIEIFTDNLKKEKVLNFEKKKEQLFSILKNSKLHRLMSKNLSKNIFFKKIKFKKILLETDKYNLIINTENSNFLTRKFFSKNIIKTYNSTAYTTIIKHEKISNKVAIQIFTKKGPLAFLPISETETSIVYSIHKSKFDSIDEITDLIHKYNFKYKINKIKKLKSFDLKSFHLRSYYHKNILAFGDLLHRVHPLAGQGFNMTIRDIMIFLKIIKNKISLGLPLDQSINHEFQKKMRHKNLIFSTGIDLLHEIFNFERKLKSNILSKSIRFLGNKPSLNKIFVKIADKGISL